MNQAELNKILNEHELWLRTNGKKGRRANLGGSDLKEIVLYNAELTKACLCRTNLKGAYLAYANLEAADLSGANLQDAILEGANLSSANLESVNLRYANLEGVDLTGANLQNANLREAELDEAILVNANLQGANLEKTNLFSAVMDDANLTEANLKNSIFKFASLEGACFDGADFSGADYTEAIVNNTDLEELIQRNRRDSVVMKKINIDPDILEKAKSKFMETVITAVNQEQIKDVVVEKYGLASINGINIKNGDFLSHNNQIAYRIEFETTILLSCLLDSEGNLIDGVSQISVDSSKDE